MIDALRGGTIVVNVTRVIIDVIKRRTTVNVILVLIDVIKRWNDC